MLKENKMKKKLLILILILAIASSFLLTSCTTESKLIVFLGDSIAEGINGITPISERDNYAYYAVIGKNNDYIYKNRAVGGYTTSDLLELIQTEDEDARMTQTLLKDADILHISILGNDLLGNDLGQLMISASNDDFDFINSFMEESSNNFAEIISILKSYNEDATIIVQNIYNPVFEYSTLINSTARAGLAAIGIEESDYREIAGTVLQLLNNIISDYLDENPGAFYIIDTYSVFEEVYEADSEQGKDLIFTDNIHPSDEGHAIMADLTQDLLENLGLADADSALKNYKSLRKEQLEEMYSDTVDVKTVSKAITKADSCAEITEIYFDAIRDITPVYC
jgi:lysophospholipase L1-like esterase